MNVFFDTIDEKVEIEDVPGAYDLPAIRGEVEYDNVTFAYEEGHNILENVSFKVKPGQSIALVGTDRRGKEHYRQYSLPLL